MKMRRAAMAAAVVLVLTGCGNEPVDFEGTFLGKPLALRSALFGPPPVSPFSRPQASGATLLFTDAADYCDYLRRVREAEARGEPAPPPPSDRTDSLTLVLTGEQMVPNQLAGGTYGVVAQGTFGVLPPLRAVATFSRKGASGAFSEAGALQLAFAEMTAGSETTGELSLELSGSPRGTLQGTFTATYCEHL